MVFSPVGLRMSILTVSLFILLMAGDSLSEQEALEPNCTGVKDFKACLGNTDSFCPTNISCQCKNEKPFCRCDYFRLDWKEYWYMGPKCNHLWNTLDFILVATLPALVLVMVVVVIFYCVSHCKSKKAGSQSNPPYREAWHNPGFTAEEADNSQHFYQPRDNSEWVRQIPKAMARRPGFDDVPAPGHLDNYSHMPPRPSRRPDPAADLFPNQRPPYEQFGYAGQDLPYPNYAEERQYWKQ